MIPLFNWLLHGEDFWPRLVMTGTSITTYITGAKWHPEDELWWVGLVGAFLFGSVSKRGGQNGSSAQADNVHTPSITALLGEGEKETGGD